MNILEVKNLEKKYPKFHLKNVSFALKEGTIMGFIGRNGAGKTTTLKGITNLINIDNGEVIYFNKNFFGNEDIIKEDVALLVNGVDFFPHKKIKHITQVTKRFYKNWDDKLYKRYLEHFGLDEEKQLRNLSQGMKIKYLLSLALSRNAKILILDEPTSGLDPISREEILDIFLKLVNNKKVSILFSTHITSDLDKTADDITYIRDGEIILSDSKENIINNYAKIEGPKEILDDLDKEKIISFKNYRDKFEGLIDIKNINYFKEKNIKTSSPTIEDIMIFLERSYDDEEFAL